MLEAETPQTVLSLGVVSWDLDEGDLSRCGGSQTGAPCRGFEAGGIVAFCRCINLSDPATSLEVKALLTRATGRALEPHAVWTVDDERVLLDWIEEVSGLYLPDVRRPWLSGFVTAGSLALRTPSGFAYPSARGILVLLDHCLGEGFSGCEGYPALNAAVGQLGVGVAPIDALAVYPPMFGATGGAPAPARQPPPPQEPAPPAPQAAEKANMFGWVILGSLGALAIYYVMR